MSYPKQNDPLTLQSQTGREEIILTESIPQATENIPFLFELPPGTESFGIDSFVGKISTFKLYTNAKRRLLEAGVLVP